MIASKLFCRVLCKSNVYLQGKTILPLRVLQRAQSFSIFQIRKSPSVYLIDEENTIKDGNSKKYDLNKYTERTCTCGDLRVDNVGERVVLCGWLEYQRMNKFLILRDSYGETQLLIGDKSPISQQILDQLNYESIIKVKGTVLSRPKDMVNTEQATGDVEILIEEFEVLNHTSVLPFNIREFQKAKEPLRMQYRYLDLRFPHMQNNLRKRSAFLMTMRQFLVNAGFVDVETPTLFKATPGGAQEFVVPTRFPGQFYSLVQSPQQFKQMLMAGAIDRYFQIARCYRDEGARPDRQPEFTQLDIEVSFTNFNNIMKLIEDLLNYSWPEFAGNIPAEFKRIKYKDALELYGTDKPDTRFGFMLQNCTDLLLLNSNFISENFGAYCLNFSEEFVQFSKSIKERLQGLGKQYPSAKLIQSKIVSTGEWLNKISKLLSTNVAEQLKEKINIQNNNLLFLVYGDKKEVLALLGKIRLEYVSHLENLGLEIRKKGMHFCWITDFPLFEEAEDLTKLNSAHHPFTAPHPEDVQLLDTNPLEVRALAYDLVLNGHEVGGGSIRIHDPELQGKIFEMLNIDENNMKHILEMLASGCPPHGGIALGLDRLLSILLNTKTIRDVIAFPKNFEGRDPVSGAPSNISDKDLKLYHIKCVNSTNKSH